MSVVESSGRFIGRTTSEQLAECEKAIEHGAFLIGGSLLRIRDGRLYQAAGFSSFERYCIDRWEMSRAYAYQQIQAAQIVDELSAIADTPTPKNESQARPLHVLPNVEQKAEAMQIVAEEAGEDFTAADVKHAVEKVQDIHAPKPDPDDEIVDAEIVEFPEAARQPSAKTEPPKQSSTHPARFSAEILSVLSAYVRPEDRVLDPFAGTGRIHELEAHTIGIEIEAEWADFHPDTIHADARDLLNHVETGTVDVVATSPAYGNRMADVYDPDNDLHRSTYTRALGHELTEGNSGAMQWGDEYRALHEVVWQECWMALRPGGAFVLNIKDHVRAGEIAHVASWHVDYLCRRLEMELVAHHMIPTRGLPSGDNALVRVPCEEIYVFRKEAS